MSSATALRVARLAVVLGTRIHDERARRRWTLRELGRRAGISAAGAHAVEAGRVASLETYVRICDALGLRLEATIADPRTRAAARVDVDADFVHAAMGELEVDHLGGLGFATGIDEPYQRFHFAGRADVVAWDVARRALLHIENRTRFPDIQAAGGAWNAKRTYLPGELANRLQVPGGWASVVHVMAVLWSAEVLHTLRLRTATFRALCPDAVDAFAAWWSGSPPAKGRTSTLIVLDPCAAGRRRRFRDLDDALRAEPRHRGYADAATALRLARRPASRASVRVIQDE